MDTAKTGDWGDTMHNILVLCTGNSARSILAEVLINHHGRDSLRGFSAGSAPKGKPHPVGLGLLERKGHYIDGLSSKSWDVFAQDRAPTMSLIITVCDNANDEVCPIWPGHPCQVHWGLADPAAAPEDQQQLAFERTYDQLERRIKALVSLDFDGLDALTLQQRASQIHEEALKSDDCR